MKQSKNGTPMNIENSRQAGFSFIEVLAGIAVFAIGILGLALLQTNLTRSQADANARGVATALSERLLERTRGFAHLADDGGSGLPVYTALTATAIENALPSNPLAIGGVPYTVDARVFDYRWDAATTQFVCWPNTDNDNDARCTGTGTEPTLPSDYKLIEIETTWDGADFVLQGGTDENASVTDRLDSGTVVVSTVITSVPTGINAKVQTSSDGNSVLPLLPYTPGQAPEVIALNLGDNLRKESTRPVPEVLRSEYVETKWEVITYTTQPNNAFQRREEFIAVSCECTLDTGGGTGYTPVYWAGDEYAGGEEVTKAVTGSSATNQQSSYCTACCRDHHDDTSKSSGNDSNNVLYRPFDTDRVDGNHKHYDAVGNLAGNGDRYLEACRLVRKDGFFRVAQDLRQEDLLVTPGDWLQSGGDQQTTYSSYVTGAIDAYYEDVKTDGDYTSSPPCIGETQSPPCAAGPPNYGAAWDSRAGDNVLLAYPNRTTVSVLDDAFPSWTYLNHDALAEQQMRVRAVYLDYLSDDLRDVIECVDDLTPPVDQADLDGCSDGEVDLDARYLLFNDSDELNKLSLLPFSELQLTKLAKWGEYPIGTPVNATSDPIADNNAHSRGEVSSDGYGGSEVTAYSYRGNLALTDTTPIRPSQASTNASLIVQAVNSSGDFGTSPEPPSGFELVTGSVIADNYDVEGLNGATCDTPTLASYECSVPDTGTPQLRIYGYGKNNQNWYVCPQDNGGIALRCVTTGFATRDAETVCDLYVADDGVTVPTGAGWNLIVRRDTPCN